MKIIEIDNKGLRKKDEPDSSKTIIQNLKKSYPKLEVEITNEEINKTWVLEINQDYQLGHLKYKVAH